MSKVTSEKEQGMRQSELRAIAHRIETAARLLEERMPARARRMRKDAARLRALAPMPWEREGGLAMTFETELRQVQKLEPGDVYLWRSNRGLGQIPGEDFTSGQLVTRKVIRVERCAHGTAIVRVRSTSGAEFDAHIGGRVEVIRPVTLEAV